MSNKQTHVEIPAPQGKGKAIVFSLITLLSGVIIGSGLTMITMGYLHPKPADRGPEFVSARMLRGMKRELGLQPEQKEQLKPILQQHMKAMDDLREKARPKFEQEMKSMNENILSILDDNQKQIWQNKIKEMQERFARFGRDRDRRGDRRGDRDRDGRRPGDRRGPRDGMGPGMGGPGPGDETGRQWHRRPDGFGPPPDPNNIPVGAPGMPPLPEEMPEG